MTTYFSYKGINNKTGKSVYGKIEAPNELAVEQMLSDSNITLIGAKEIKQSKLSVILSLTKKITDKELIGLFVSLEQLEKAGVPLLDSIKDLKDFSENVKIKDIMQDIYEDVKGGTLLSSSMAKHPKIFDSVMISLIAMGEKTGKLARAFRNIYDNIKWNLDIKRKVSKAVVGPMLSIALLVAISGILLKFVVPKVLGFILEQEIKVPGYTTALIKTSDFVQKYFLLILLIIAGFVVLLKVIRKTSKNFRIKMDSLKLKMPILGPVMQKIDLSRFSKFFGITFDSGIPILECISIANNIVVNAFIKNEIDMIRQKISEGFSLTRSINESSCFPFMVVRMFKIGEESGNIESAMQNINYFYESEIDDGIEMVVSSIKPLILFVMGGFMCWIIAAVFGPIYGNFANMV